MNPHSTVSLLSFLFLMSPNLSLPKSDNLSLFRSKMMDVTYDVFRNFVKNNTSIFGIL